MRPGPASSRRTIARALATLVVALCPGLALAGPPVLPPTGGQGGGSISSSPAAPGQGNTFATIPVQRPAGLQVAEVTPVRPVAPVQPTVAQPAVAQPAAAQPVSPIVVAPPEVGPQPAPAAAPAVVAPAPAPSAAAIAPEPSEPEAGDSVPEAALVAKAEPKRKKYLHKGFVADFRIGTLGCIGAFCRGAHDVSPGVRLGGFLGGNIRGWVELGVGGGWGTLGTKIAPGTNAMLLYGLDPNVLQLALLAQAAGLINVDLAGLAVQDDQLRVAQFGPSLRVHLLPRGRIGAFVGSGVGYNVLKARYTTAIGDVGMDFHGIDVPVEANLSVYVLEHLAVGLQLDYMWTWYGLAVLDHPQQKIPIPMRLLQGTAATQGVDVREQLPQFWTLGLAIRGRL